MIRVSLDNTTTIPKNIQRKPTMSCRVINFHVVRSALQYSACWIYYVYYQKRLNRFVTKWSRLNVKTSVSEMPTSGDSLFFTTPPEFQRYFCGKINSQSRFFKAWESRQNSTTPALVALRKTRENQWWSCEMLAVFSGWVFWTFHSLNSAKRR